jgi:small-conductance mechanosensitive channel
MSQKSRRKKSVRVCCVCVLCVCVCVSDKRLYILEQERLSYYYFLLLVIIIFSVITLFCVSCLVFVSVSCARRPTVVQNRPPESLFVRVLRSSFVSHRIIPQLYTTYSISDHNLKYHHSIYLHLHTSISSLILALQFTAVLDTLLLNVTQVCVCVCVCVCVFVFLLLPPYLCLLLQSNLQYATWTRCSYQTCARM